MVTHPVVTALFVGTPRLLPGESHSSAIYKHPVSVARFGPEGLEGDQQADRRVHGGPEKAVHAYPAEHYAALAARFPAAAPQLIPGSIGENLSVLGLTEKDACIGDVYALGSARLQLAQPRTPCWKIDTRYDQDGMARFIGETGLAGWYFRVLASGETRPGDRLELVDRNAAPISLAQLWQWQHALRPDPECLEAAAATAGLTANWVKKLTDRARWLRDQGGAPATPLFHVKPEDR